MCFVISFVHVLIKMPKSKRGRPRKKSSKKKSQSAWVTYVKKVHSHLKAYADQQGRKHPSYKMALQYAKQLYGKNTGTQKVPVTSTTAILPTAPTSDIAAYQRAINELYPGTFTPAGPGSPLWQVQPQNTSTNPPPNPAIPVTSTPGVDAQIDIN